MPIRFGVGLPGPFYYTPRQRCRSSGGDTASGCFWLLFGPILVVVVAIAVAAVLTPLVVWSLIWVIWFCVHRKSVPRFAFWHPAEGEAADEG